MRAVIFEKLCGTRASQTKKGLKCKSLKAENCFFFFIDSKVFSFVKAGRGSCGHLAMLKTNCPFHSRLKNKYQPDKNEIEIKLPISF